ncbi:MAG: helix-turn-helix transcriptional regulator, partial [Muribaculaceae bacterium]|nr:helix-turn-helix transcriptional regulator [Muribaculaceae bacterium]
NLVMSRLHLQNIYSGRQTQEDSLDNIDTTSTDDRLMERIMKVINSRMADPDFTIEEFASEVGMSRLHLHRKLKELTNQSPGAFLRNLRLQQAARLLADGKIPVAEVAYTVGFRNPNHFATAFKELFGMPPTAYAPATSNRQQNK